MVVKYKLFFFAWRPISRLQPEKRVRTGDETSIIFNMNSGKKSQKVLYFSHNGEWCDAVAASSPTASLYRFRRKPTLLLFEINILENAKCMYVLMCVHYPLLILFTEKKVLCYWLFYYYYNANHYEENSRKRVVNEFVMHYFYPQRQQILLCNLISIYGLF